jgi:hypothetical protein
MDDDVALIWLQDQKQTGAVARYLNANAPALFIDEVMAGDELKLKFNNPLHDSRVPDLIVQPQYGTIYTGSTKKNSEHGGFSFGDTNVGLIVSHPALSAHVVKTPVATSQVAPTILKSLELNPKAVRVEQTPMLPGLPHNAIPTGQSLGGPVRARSQALRRSPTTLRHESTTPPQHLSHLCFVLFPRRVRGSKSK